MTGDDIVKEKGVYDALSIDKIDKKLEEMAEIAMGHPYAMWPSVLALAVLVLTCIICVVRRRNFKKPTKTYVYKPLLDQEGTRFKISGLPGHHISCGRRPIPKFSFLKTRIKQRNLKTRKKFIRGQMLHEFLY